MDKEAYAKEACEVMCDALRHIIQSLTFSLGNASMKLPGVMFIMLAPMCLAYRAIVK